MTHAEDVARMGSDELMALARDEGGYLIQAHAMRELARRAEAEAELLDPLLACIGSHIRIRTRRGLPLGSLAARELMDAPSPTVEERIALAVSGWPLWEQVDFFRLILPDAEQAAVAQRWAASYGFAPKFSVEGGELVAREVVGG